MPKGKLELGVAKWPQGWPEVAKGPQERIQAADKLQEVAIQVGVAN